MLVRKVNAAQDEITYDYISNMINPDMWLMA